MYIQIQHLLKLNLLYNSHELFTLYIQIQHLLKLNKTMKDLTNVLKENSNTTFVKVKC